MAALLLAVPLTVASAEYKLVITRPDEGETILSTGGLATTKLAVSDRPGDMVKVKLVPVPSTNPLPSVQLASRDDPPEGR